MPQLPSGNSRIFRISLGPASHKCFKVDFHCRVIYVRTYVNFTRVNIMEPECERPWVNVQVERNLPDIAPIIFTRVKFT